MKKTIYLLLLSFLAVSCYEEIVLPVGDDEPRGVMNAQLNTMNTSHTVYLSVTRKSHVKALSGAGVRVFVNGTLAATAEEMPPRYEGVNEAGYAFEATFRPGDEVRIEATKDAFSLTSTVTVPQPVTVSSIDTSTVKMTYMGETGTYLQVKTNFQDLPGSTFYRIDGRIMDDYQYLDEDMNPVSGYAGTGELYLGLETGFDPVISEGGGKTGGTDLATLLADGYSYHCFSDIPFSGEECTIRPLINPSFYLRDYPYMSYAIPEDVTDEELPTLYDLYLSVRRRACVQLRTLDFSQYHYLKSLENLETFGTDLIFLVEPTTLPSNVEGGLGFVGIEAVTELMFYEETRVFPPLGAVYYDDDTLYGYYE